MKNKHKFLVKPLLPPYEFIFIFIFISPFHPQVDFGVVTHTFINYDFSFLWMINDLGKQSVFSLQWKTMFFLFFYKIAVFNGVNESFAEQPVPIVIPRPVKEKWIKLAKLLWGSDYVFVKPKWIWQLIKSKLSMMQLFTYSECGCTYSLEFVFPSQILNS